MMILLRVGLVSLSVLGEGGGGKRMIGGGGRVVRDISCVGKKRR